MDLDIALIQNGQDQRTCKNGQRIRIRQVRNVSRNVSASPEDSLPEFVGGTITLEHCQYKLVRIANGHAGSN